jgi:prepilin-type N-terminal cleavage/methylation domain-containing protein
LLQSLRSSLRTAFSARTRRGFTLIEIAIVLVVIGLLLSGGLLATSPILQSARLNETKQKMATVEAALLGYVIANGCLPCPAVRGAATTGQAQFGATTYTNNCNTGICVGTTAGVGLVPWVTLGIAENDATDAWNQRFTYAVDPTRTVADSMERNADGSFPNFVSTLVMENLANGDLGYTALAYVLVSHGPDGALGETSAGVIVQDKYAQGALSTGQGENGNDDLRFSTGQTVTTNNNARFDDIVSFKSFQPLILSCGAGSCGNPS